MMILSRLLRVWPLAAYSLLLLCIGVRAQYMPPGGGGTQYKTWSGCNSGGLGDGLNAIAAGTYLQSNCYNTTGVTVTLTAIKCYTDGGSSTLNAANGAGTALLTGAINCSTAFAGGTQGSTVTLASGDFIKFTFVADGTTKQTSWAVTGTY
jgi:hypothetical protein